MKWIVVGLAVMIGTISGRWLYDSLHPPTRCTMTIYPLPPR